MANSDFWLRWALATEAPGYGRSTQPGPFNLPTQKAHHLMIRR